MDRTLKVYANTGHLFAEVNFNYDHPRQASGHYTLYRRLYDDHEEDENKSVFPLMDMDLYLTYREFESIEKIKEHDIEVVKKELGRDMTDPRGYNYVYDTTPVLQRYILENHNGCMAMINVLYSFIDNTKEVKLLSATHPRYDVDISSNSLETNLSCILRTPLYIDRDVREISSHDLKKAGTWY